MHRSARTSTSSASLIEHYAGNFPLWLAPEQVRVLTLNDDEKLVAYAKEIHRELRANEVRAEADFSPTRSKPRSPKPKKPKSTPCSSSAGAMWTPAT